MSFRKTVFALTLVGAAIPAAFATTGITQVGGEKGIESHTMPITKSRADVQKELAEFRKTPVGADGGIFMGGEAGYVAPQHSYAFRGGKLVHVDTMNHNKPKPNVTFTEQERTARQQNSY